MRKIRILISNMNIVDFLDHYYAKTNCMQGWSLKKCNKMHKFRLTIFTAQ